MYWIEIECHSKGYYTYWKVVFDLQTFPSEAIADNTNGEDSLIACVSFIFDIVLLDHCVNLDLCCRSIVVQTSAFSDL